MKRDTTKTIWRTVVFAGAMLGAPACGKKQPQTTPTNKATPAATDQAVPASTDNATPAPKADPCAADPCAGAERPRGTDEDGGGGMGRGFVLS